MYRLIISRTYTLPQKRQAIIADLAIGLGIPVLGMILRRYFLRYFVFKSIFRYCRIYPTGSSFQYHGENRVLPFYLQHHSRYRACLRPAHTNWLCFWYLRWFVDCSFYSASPFLTRSLPHQSPWHLSLQPEPQGIQPAPLQHPPDQPSIRSSHVPHRIRQPLHRHFGQLRSLQERHCPWRPPVEGMDGYARRFFPRRPIPSHRLA